MINTSTSHFEAVVRFATPEFEALNGLLFRRYPHWEWASFVRFGWRDTKNALVLSLATIREPQPGDVDESVGHVAIQEQYTLRLALEAERDALAVGIVHSHPSGSVPRPSWIDDDMDEYYAEYFSGFAPDRPYVSLIATQRRDDIILSGRVFWRGQWIDVRRFLSVGTRCTPFALAEDQPIDHMRARFVSAFGGEAQSRLRRATVAVIGAGGTGSIAIEVLARAGIGRLIIIDPDVVEDSNLERLHGSTYADRGTRKYKTAIAADHVRGIDPACRVTSIIGAIPQPEVVDEIVGADVVLGCTDQQHSRLALSDITVRYLVPAIDCGVMLEGAEGQVTGQVIQLIRNLPSDGCVLCRKMTDPVRIASELMSDAEKKSRIRAAAEARVRGDDPNAYWSGLPQLNTVGYLTGIAGSFAAAYAIGWISGRFEPPFQRLQMNIVAPEFDVHDIDDPPSMECVCRRIRGHSDQASADAFISAPHHWPRVIVS